MKNFFGISSKEDMAVAILSLMAVIVFGLVVFPYYDVAVPHIAFVYQRLLSVLSTGIILMAVVRCVGVSLYIGARVNEGELSMIELATQVLSVAALVGLAAIIRLLLVWY